MLQRGHGVYFLDEALLELGVLDHLLLGEALDRVEDGRTGGLGGQQHVPEAPLAYLPHAVELLAVQDVPRLHLQVTL